MTRGDLFRLAAAAAVLAFLLSTDLGGQRRLSVDLWLAVVATWSAVRLARTIITRTPVDLPKLRLPIGLGGGPKPAPVPLPRDLQALEGGIVAGTHSHRAFSHRLRPRLRDVVEHRLRLDHGIDLTREPDRARAVLGNAMDLVEPDGTEQPPTTQDITDLLRKLEPSEQGAP